MVYFFALDREDALNGNAIALPRQYQERKPQMQAFVRFCKQSRAPKPSNLLASQGLARARRKDSFGEVNCHFLTASM
jgi:hypothetical protein